MSENSAHVSFLPGSCFDLDFLADLYTRTFAEYFYPCLVTTAEMEEIVRVEQLDLDRCPVMLFGKEPVGFATLGIRGSESYCRGFGVIVPYRGKGLGHVLCDEMIRLAKDAGARRMVLGVIKENIPALQTYGRAGFQTLREMISLEWRADADGAGRRNRKEQRRSGCRSESGRPASSIRRSAHGAARLGPRPAFAARERRSPRAGCHLGRRLRSARAHSRTRREG